MPSKVKVAMRTPFLKMDNGKLRRKSNHLPARPKIQMSRQKAGNEKCDAGTDAAAFFRHFNRDARQGKQEPVAQHRNSHRLENEIGNFGRAFLQCVYDPVQNHIRERNHEQKKQQRKGRRP